MNAADSAPILKRHAARLLDGLEQTGATIALREEVLSELIYQAEAREHRRAMRHLRDSACYRLGSAFEASDGLSLDPVTLAGWLALGDVAVLLLVQRALAKPDRQVAGHLADLFASSIGHELRAWGVWVRWHWMRELYEAETTAFLASPAARRTGWRKQKPTRRQTALVAAMCEFLQKDI